MTFTHILRTVRAIALLALLHCTIPSMAAPAGYGVLLRPTSNSEFKLLRVFDLAVEKRPSAGPGEELIWVDKELTMAMPLSNSNRMETLPNGNKRVFDYLPVVQKLAPEIRAGMDARLLEATKSMMVAGTQVCMKFQAVTAKLPTGLLYMGQPATREVKGVVNVVAFVDYPGAPRMKVLVNSLKFVPENDLEPVVALNEFHDGDVVLKPQLPVWVYMHEWHPCN